MDEDAAVNLRRRLLEEGQVARQRAAQEEKDMEEKIKDASDALKKKEEKASRLQVQLLQTCVKRLQEQSKEDKEEIDRLRKIIEEQNITKDKSRQLQEENHQLKHELAELKEATDKAGYYGARRQFIFDQAELARLKAELKEAQEDANDYKEHADYQAQLVQDLLAAVQAQNTQNATGQQ